MTGLTGKSVLITGASRGIGAATAREFAARGAKVLLTARSEPEIAQIAQEIRDQGQTALHLAVDVADYAQVQAAVDLAVAEFGGLDVLINNAGILEPVSRLADVDVDGWDKVIDINVKGVFHGMRAALPVMKSAGGGTIITVGSGAATTPLEGWSHYSASKAAVHHLSRVLHVEEAANGIRTLVLSPGTVATDMQVIIRDSGINAVSKLKWEDHIPPEWPAKAMVWMCDPASDSYQGEVVSLRDPDLRRKMGLT